MREQGQQISLIPYLFYEDGSLIAGLKATANNVLNYSPFIFFGEDGTVGVEYFIDYIRIREKLR